MHARKAVGLFVVLAVGFVAGVLVAGMATHALSLRSAHARGTMQLMQVHLRRLHDAVRRDDCASLAPERHFARLAALSPEIEYAFAERFRSDARFVSHLSGLRRALEGAPAAYPDCKAVATALAPVADACESCHRDYR